MTSMICMYDEFAKHFARIKVEIKIEERENLMGDGRSEREKKIKIK